MQPLTVAAPAPAAKPCANLAPVPRMQEMRKVFPSDVSTKETSSVCIAPEICLESQVISPEPGLPVHVVVVRVPSAWEEIASVSSTFKVSGYSLASPAQSEGTTAAIRVIRPSNLFKAQGPPTEAMIVPRRRRADKKN